MLSARSPKYPALYDVASGVRFRSGKARVTDTQAQLLADRPFLDGILLGEFDDENRIVNELPAKDWRKTQRREQASPTVTSGNAGAEEQPDDTTDGAGKAHVPEPRRQ